MPYDLLQEKNKNLTKKKMKRKLSKAAENDATRRKCKEQNEKNLEKMKE